MCPVRYDESVKRPGEENEWTPELIKELKRCKEDILYFVKYVKIISIDEGRIQFKPYKFQMDILKLIETEQMVAIKCARQNGKCLFKDTKIKIRNKKTGLTEEIEIEKFFNKTKL